MILMFVFLISTLDCCYFFLDVKSEFLFLFFSSFFHPRSSVLRWESDRKIPEISPSDKKTHTHTHTHKNTKQKKHLNPNEGTSDLVDAGQDEDR